VPGDGAFQLAGEVAGITRIFETDIVQRKSPLAQCLSKVAHGRENKGDLLLVLVDIDRLGPDLDHEDEVPRLVEAGEGAEPFRELVAKDEDEVSDRHGQALRGLQRHGCS